MKHLAGWLLISAPFVGVFICSVISLGWKEAVLIWLGVVAIILSIGAGVVLIHP
jgi:hypothetical protein